MSTRSNLRRRHINRDHSGEPSKPIRVVHGNTSAHWDGDGDGDCDAQAMVMDQSLSVHSNSSDDDGADGEK